MSALGGMEGRSPGYSFKINIGYVTLRHNGSAGYLLS